MGLLEGINIKQAVFTLTLSILVTVVLPSGFRYIKSGGINCTMTILGAYYLIHLFLLAFMLYRNIYTKSSLDRTNLISSIKHSFEDQYLFKVSYTEDKELDSDISRSIDAVISQALVRVEEVRDCWLFVVLIWLFMYLYLGLCEIINDISINLLIVKFVVIGITLLFLVMYSLFSRTAPNLTIKGSFESRPIPIILYLVFCVVHIFVMVYASNSILFYFDVAHAVITASVFLAFFSRLDSLFLQISKFFLWLLILYGMSQIIYPFLSSSLEAQKGMLINIFLLSIVGVAYF